MIPHTYDNNFCNSGGIVDCNYYKDSACPRTCNFAKGKIKEEPIIIKTGLERFLSKFGKSHNPLVNKITGGT